MEKLFKESKEIISEAGLLLKEAFYKPKNISAKSSAFDLVTDTDKYIEAFLIDKFKELLPQSSFLSEESNPELKSAEYLWIIDPIDGTTNFVHKFPFVCISVALMINGELALAFVYNPIMDEFFHAIKNSGAYLNNNKIYVSSGKELSKAFMATGFAYNFSHAEEDNIKYFKNMTPRVHGIRRPGSAALDLCYVAKGVYDAYWEWYLNPWDVCAGILIVQEAGGKVTNFENTCWDFEDINLIATNHHLHQICLENLNEIRKMS